MHLLRMMICGCRGTSDPALTATHREAAVEACTFSHAEMVKQNSSFLFKKLFSALIFLFKRLNFGVKPVYSPGITVIIL